MPAQVFGVTVPPSGKVDSSFVAQLNSQFAAIARALAALQGLDGQTTTLMGGLDLSGKPIKNVADPTQSHHAANLRAVRNAIDSSMAGIPLPATNAPATLSAGSVLGAVIARFAREDHAHGVVNGNNVSYLPSSDLTVLNTGTLPIAVSTVAGLLVVAVKPIGTSSVGLIALSGTPAVLAASPANFSVTLGNPATINVNVNGGNWMLENQTGSTQTVRMLFLGTLP